MDDDELRETFANRIRALRKVRNLSQEKTAALAGLDRAGYGRVERGLVDIRLSTINRIAGALEVQISELFVDPPRSRKGTKSRTRSGI